jgi:hypothetical protein
MVTFPENSEINRIYSKVFCHLNSFGKIQSLCLSHHIREWVFHFPWLVILLSLDYHHGEAT